MLDKIIEIPYKTSSINISRQGDPSVLTYSQEVLGEPGPGEVKIRQAAIGLNFVDTYFRSGMFPVKAFPYVPGIEAAGVIEATGPWVTDFKVGDRVAYHFIPGAYAEVRIVGTHQLVHVPDNVSLEEAAAVMVKGFTARMLVKETYKVKPGDVVLVHAAAGGVGSLVSKWAKALGATVIGTVGSEGKRQIAVGNGIDYVFLTHCEGFAKSVLDITKGRGVDVVYDGVGKDTFAESIGLIKQGGKIVLYGSSSGQPEHIDHAALRAKSINMLTPVLNAYISDYDSLHLFARDTFAALQSGIFDALNITRYSLSEAAKAHRDIESRETIGSVILIP
ncbi:quinone oxidoreductase family protein [Dyadobacter fanqingshengii]|uniref:Quinone oxidoreductase n=1 Tax=Dyadobacter fanqingshengii TaxID=2906443 RepID=A0A9X1PCX7_9BACT|nr:quinone oxidoreductase [Dyadobacter fanqingshengii]MCF0042205.1 quinone oxidoreductase [Dyadobacter fanqingshengii]USJ35264.1 quinone oxidoreductase [Dyadobacter fanqingshengii]